MNNSDNIDYSEQIQKGFYPCKFEMGENYKFINKNIFFRFFSLILYLIAMIVLWPITRVLYGLRVKGKKHLKKIKNAVFVSNHILEVDFCAIITNILFFKRPYILTLTETFKMPVIRTFIKLLRAVPIPNDVKSTRNFLKQTDKMLKDGGSLLVFSEGSMWPYFDKIRPFKSGAFRFSVKNNVPIVPLVTTLRKPNLFYRILGRKKPLATLNVLEPIYPNQNLSSKISEQELQEKTFNIMSKFFNDNSNSNGYVSKQVKRYFDNFNKNT